MLRQRRYGAETLAALVALDLHATIGMHALVPAEIRELRVGFEAHLALERLHRRVNVRVLLETRRGREGFSALGTRVTAGADVMGANVSLKIRRVGEFLERERRSGREN